MFLKKNIWLIFYALLLLGLIYLVISIFSTWHNIKTKTAEEISNRNHLFVSSVTSTFEQQEMMLELLGQQLLNDDQYKNKENTTIKLDRLLKQNTSLIGFGLANLDGQLLVTSSNIDLDKMPNLKESENSRITFNKALETDKMVLGKTYYLEPIKNWVIPIRKAIRNIDNQLQGMMIAGINPGDLLPKFNHFTKYHQNYRVMLIHDHNFRYAYISGNPDISKISDLINNPIPTSDIDTHKQSIQQQLNMTLDDLRNNVMSAEYFAPSIDGKPKLYSIIYLPEYQLWSLSFIPKSILTDQLISSSLQYGLTFVGFFIIIFFLFRYIHKFELKNRQQLISQANHDFLTGLNNRQYLKDAEPDWIYDNADKFSVFFMDLDNFKNINDSYGHNYGDLILKQVAIRLLSIFPETSLVCRQGGDEFIILCKQTSEKKLGKIATTVLDKLSHPYEIDNYLFNIGVSIGICRYPADGKTFDALFSAADAAMYYAKNNKQNYFIFTNNLKQQINKTSEIEQSLHTALQNNEFHMVYQPQIASRGALFGVEALIRWNNAELGSIPPDQFIPVAEDNGLILELGHFIIDQSIKDISELSRSNDSYDLQLSINISVRQFLELGFLDYLKSSLLHHQFPSRHLTLEITESIFIEDIDYMTPIFNEIRALGIKISLDDFGTGFSSLSMLKKLPIDELKIDKSFIDNCTNNNQDKSMVINILNIAQNQGLKVVAEGIESQSQAELLAKNGCDIQQGYFYARPLDYKSLEEFCNNYKPPAKIFKL